MVSCSFLHILLHCDFSGVICLAGKCFNSLLYMCRLQKQGYKYDKLCQAFKKFTKRHNTIINKFGVSIHDHIKEGISLPLSTCTTKLSRFDTGHMKLSRYSVLYVDSYRYPVLCVMLYVTFSLSCLINFVIHQLNGESWYHQRSLTHHT